MADLDKARPMPYNHGACDDWQLSEEDFFMRTKRPGLGALPSILSLASLTRTSPGLCHLKEERYENRIESDSGIVTEDTDFLG